MRAGRAPLLAGVIASLIDGVMIVVYLVALSAQGGPVGVTRVVFVAAYLSALGVLSLVGGLVARAYPRVADDLQLSGATGNLGLGVIASASIGWPLILAGIVLLMVPRDWRPVLTSRGLFPPAAALIVLALGMLVTP